MALSIISLNVNGLCESSKHGLVQWLQSLPVTVDVECLQESHCTSDEECRSSFPSSRLSFVLSPGTRRFGGCIILYHSVLQLINSWCEVSGHSLLCEFSLYDVFLCALLVCSKSQPCLIPLL